MITADERAADFSIAVEYRGPPVGYDIPRAIPIEIDSIPVAAVASVAASDGVSTLPVVHPLLSPSPIKKFPSPVRGTAVGSPTSVIAFEPSGEVGTSGALVASSGEVGSSEIAPSSSDLRASESSWCDIVPERPSTDSVLSSDFGSPTADIDGYTEDEEEEGFDGEGRRPALVTFEDSAESSGAVGVAEAVPELAVKKGACYRCLQGSRFTEKEACLVCNAKYCSRCVLRAMGSMPEGRKCVGCMGSPIEESRRDRLGKSSRLLKRLLSSLEVQQVLKAEKECEANQLRPDFVCVNGRKLGPEEMVLLQSCSCPPTKLKPGYYWYDKVAGFWGKEGQKPHQIISPHLNVGAGIMRHASKGDTGILINDREITKSELRMLQWAGVQCAGKPHFWVNADGTYQEEGQKNIKGKIWEKPTTKLLCSFLSLPVPSKASNPSGEDVPNTINRVMPEYLEKKTLQKILLVGSYGSGTSTIFKQAKFLYRSVPFSDDERQSVKVMIHSNIYTYLGILLEGRERFEEESLLEINKARSLHSSGTENDISDDCGEMTEYSISPRLKAFSDWLLKVMASGDLEAIFPAATREYAPKVEELWNNAAIQATYRRRSELPLLPSVASYFLERVVDISRADYDPSDTDILYANGITSSNGLACTDFIFPQGASSENGIDGDDQQDTHPRYYQLIRVHTKMLVLFETPAGFALFKVVDEGKLSQVEDLWKEFTTSESARKVVKLKAFSKFENTTEALSAATQLLDSKPSKGLRKFLRAHCEGETLAVADSKLGNAIKEKLKIDCLHNNVVMELMRGLRSQLSELISGLAVQDLGPMSLGLSHSLSRYKLKFSPDKVDTMIIQAIGLLDDLDKELNTYAMRVREWYGWHFPELTKIIQDNIVYAKTVKLMGDRVNAAGLDFSEILSEEVETELKEAAIISMGTEVSDLDLSNIKALCDQVVSLSEYRAQLYDYLRSRMNTIAPNLTALVGELVGARLIAHGGSLLNLAKQPGSTIQILGAEKALFRALKTKHATPKYGLIFHASLVGQAAPKLKGKISRSLAAKSVIASRYDAFADTDDSSFGLENRAKLETRLRVLEGKELGRSAGSTKGKPKIEFYDKDRKKGAGAMITAPKTYNPAADIIMQINTSAVDEQNVTSKKRKHEDLETTQPMDSADGDDSAQVGNAEKGEKKKRKKKAKLDENATAEADGEFPEKPKKKKKKTEAEAIEQETGVEDEGTKKEKKKKRKQAEGDVQMADVEEQPAETSAKKVKKDKKKKKKEDA